MSSDAHAAGTVLVTIDSLRADAIRPDVAPNLSRLAARSTTFERAFAHGNWTPFAFPSILGSRPVFADSGDIGLAGSPTLAERLSGAGVATAGFNAANGFLTAYWGYDRGFDRFESFIEDRAGRGSKYLAAHPTVNGWVQLLASPFRRAASRFRAREPGAFVDVSHRRDVERAATAFVEAADEPFFLWVHYMDAHTPYVPAPRHLRAVGGSRMNFLSRLRAHLHTGLGRRTHNRTLAALRSLYRGTVHQVDASVGRLLDALRATGRRDSTLVVVTGDHGEEFQEHGHLAHYPKLYGELVRVPLLVDYPGAGHREVSAPVGHEVIPPTVCDVMGVKSVGFGGESVLPAVRRGVGLEPRPVTSVTVRGPRITHQPIPRRLDEGEVVVSARDERFTYIYHAESGRRELYDRAVDPAEQDDRYEADRLPERAVKPLLAAVARRLDRLGGGAADAARSRTEPSPAVDRRLEVLGYR